MTFEETIKIAAAILASLGGGGVFVFAFSNWLGKVWANRLMAADQAKHSRQLENLRAELAHDNQILLEKERAKYSRELEELKAQLVRVNEDNINKLLAQLDVLKHSQIQEYQDKFNIYRLVCHIVADLLADFDVNKGLSLSPEQLDRYNRGWMRAYGYLAMLAPQDVMDSFDRLNDYFLGLISGGETVLST